MKGRPSRDILAVDPDAPRKFPIGIPDFHGATAGQTQLNHTEVHKMQINGAAIVNLDFGIKFKF